MFPVGDPSMTMITTDRSLRSAYAVGSHHLLPKLTFINSKRLLVRFGWIGPASQPAQQSCVVRSVLSVVESTPSVDQSDAIMEIEVPTKTTTSFG